MSSPGSYHVASFAANAEAEIRRLNAQVDLFWPVESEVLFRHGLRDGMAVLDCGCGPGRLLELVQRRLPAARCTGVEIDPLLVEAGRKHLAASGLPGISIQQGSAENPGLPAASFDFIVMRLVLEHVPDPAAALRSLAALLRTGGRLAVISNDFDFHLRTSPSVPELDALYAAYRASRRHDGGDPCIGRRVPQLLATAGLRVVATEIELAHNAVLGDGPFLKAEGAGIPAQLVKSGFLDAGTLDAMTRSWREMLNTPDHAIARPLWVAVGERTAGGAEGQAGRGKCEAVGRAETEGERDTARSRRSEGPRSQDPAARESSGGEGAGGKPEAPAGAVRGKEASGKRQGLGGSADTAQAAPGSESLSRLLALLDELLERRGTKPDDTLAALAIDSIVAMLLQERIKGFAGVEIPVVRFFEEITVGDLAATLDRAPAAVSRPASTPAGPIPPPAKWVEGDL